MSPLARPSLLPPFFPPTLTGPGGCSDPLVPQPLPAHQRPFQNGPQLRTPESSAGSREFRPGKRWHLEPAASWNRSPGCQDTRRPLSWCEPQWGRTSGHCSPPPSKGASSLGAGFLGGNLTGPLCQRCLPRPSWLSEGPAGVAACSPQVPRSSFRGPEKRSQGSGPGSQGAQGSQAGLGRGFSLLWAPSSLAPPPSLDEPPSSWSGSWSHVAAPPHTGSPQPHAQSTEAQAAAPEGSPDSLLFRARPPGGLRLEPHRQASRGRRGSGGVVLCLRAVCDSPEPSPAH